ncbi:MAG: RHS repeat-associated core domain-containing protein, partial [Candidatus Polarisedimenticolia bacterium]
RDGAGQALAEYTVSPASGGGGTAAASKEYVPGFGGVVAERTWTTSMGTLPKVTFHQRDHLGSLRLVTDATGAVVEAHDYYPFGGEMGPVASSSRKKFTGHERDEETGLDYMLARYYPASMGRFLSVDPGFDVQPEDPQSWNLYGYVRNNPINATDPTGEWEWLDRLIRKFIDRKAPSRQVSEQEHKERQELLEGAGIGGKEAQDLDGKIGGVGDGEKVQEGVKTGLEKVGGALAEEGLTSAATLGAGALIKGLPATEKIGNLIRGSLKRAKGFDGRLAEMTVEEVAQLAKSGTAAEQRAAKNMLKLASDAPRLLEKTSGKPR